MLDSALTLLRRFRLLVPFLSDPCDSTIHVNLSTAEIRDTIILSLLILLGWFALPDNFVPLFHQEMRRIVQWLVQEIKKPR